MTRRVVLVVGPPGSGKSTYARRLGLPHLEREQFGSEVEFKAACEEVTAAEDAQAVVVRCCPKWRDQRLWASVLRATEVVVMPTSADECRRRIIARGRERYQSELHAVGYWFQCRSARS